MKNKKIAFVISSMSSGGAERVVSILANHLVQHYKVYIIMLTNKPVFYALHEDLNILYCKESLEPSKNLFDALKSNYSLYKDIVNFIKKFQIDLCIGFMTPNNILTTLASRRCKIPVVISERNNPYKEDLKIGFFWKKLRRLVYPMANRLVVQTERVKKFYTPFIKSNKLVTIPNPINPEFKLPQVLERENIILNVASLTEQKGQDMLIKAFAMTEPDNWSLHIVGEGPKRIELQNLIIDLKMKNRILLLGRKTDVVSYYTKSKIFAFSSLYEGFPNALQEAMFFGLACVSTNCATGPAELIDNGVNGYLIEVGDEENMTIRLSELMLNNEKVDSFKKHAQNSMQQYSIDRVLNKWLDIFKELI